MTLRARLVLPVLLACILLGGAACGTFQDDLARAQRAFEANQYERALAMCRVLEPDLLQLSVADRARYAYLRGMADYRMGNLFDARHWLALGLALDDRRPGSLPAEARERLGVALSKLDADVHAGVRARTAKPDAGVTDLDARLRDASVVAEASSPPSPP